MSTDEHRQESPAEWAERTAVAQGLPPQVENPAALSRIAALIDRPTQAEGGHR